MQSNKYYRKKDELSTVLALAILWNVEKKNSKKIEQTHTRKNSLNFDVLGVFGVCVCVYG